MAAGCWHGMGVGGGVAEEGLMGCGYVGRVGELNLSVFGRGGLIRCI